MAHDRAAARSDPLDAAIAAADKPAEVAMQQINVTIASTGRPVILAIPQDITDGELAELAGWMLTAVLGAKRAERAASAGPQLVVARGVLPPPGRN